MWLKFSFWRIKSIFIVNGGFKLDPGDWNVVFVHFQCALKHFIAHFNFVWLSHQCQWQRLVKWWNLPKNGMGEFLLLFVLLFLFFVFLYFIGSMPSQFLYAHSLLMLGVRNVWLVFVIYTLCLFEFLIVIKVLLFSTCLFLYLDSVCDCWAVVTTSIIRELTLQGQNKNDSHKVLK